MKFTVALFLLLHAYPITIQGQAGNPNYDFPDSIVARTAKGRGYINGNLSALSVSGYYRESLRYEDTLMGPPKPVYLSMADKEVMEAKKLILKEAGKYRVLMINEGHSHPEHRLFTKSLLQDLYKQGYRLFMAEGIWSNNTITAKKYPVSTDGIYLNEPAYASLIRYAIKIGYKVEAYDFPQAARKKYWDDSVKIDRNGSIKYISYEPRDSMTIILNEKGEVTFTYLTNVREKYQAVNIMKVLENNPGVKAVVHVGHGHLYESGPMMGAQLRELLPEKDILTVDQQSLSTRLPVIDTLKQDTIKKAYAYFLWNKDRQGFFRLNNGGAVDYLMFNAAIEDSLHRPGFLFHDVEPRFVYNIGTNRLQNCPCLFSAYNSREYGEAGRNAIAIDIVYTKDDNTAPPLLLYKGNYLVVKKDRQGQYTHFNVNTVSAH